jgi:predicted nucleotidyltransferase
MNLGAPFSTVVPGVPGVVLSILARTEQPLTGRNIASIAGQRASQSGVSRCLRELVASGMVIAIPAGAATLYSLNSAHVAYQPIKQLSAMYESILEQIRVEIRGWSPAPVAVALFGSVARGDAGDDSDIDVLIVRPDDIAADDYRWAAEVEALSRHVLALTGNRCDVLEYSAIELADLVRLGEPVVAELWRDALDLYGVPVRSALAGKVDA